MPGHDSDADLPNTNKSSCRLPIIGSYRLLARVEMPSAALLSGAFHSASKHSLSASNEDFQKRTTERGRMPIRRPARRLAMESPKPLWIGMVVVGASARLLPHPWNFTPMMAIGLFAGSHARKVSTGVLATLFALALSDAVLGFYPGFWYVYGAALIPVLLGRLIRNRSGAVVIAAAAFVSSFSFFLITNFV